LRLVGLIISDGHIDSQSNKIGITQSTSKDAVCAVIESTLCSLGISYKKYQESTAGTAMRVGSGSTYYRNGDKIRWVISGYDSIRIRRFFATGKQLRLPTLRAYVKRFISCDKSIPRWVLRKCRKRELRALLDGLMLGDGTWKTDKSGTYYTSDEKLANDLQHLLVLCDYRSHVRLRRGSSYEVQFSDNKFVDVTASNVEVIPYSGKTWCVSTEYGSLVTRRQGKTTITGNSEADVCEVLFVDDNFKWFVWKYKHFAPAWFMQRVRGSVSGVPEPLV
jgi:hypothetical protein